MPSSQSSFSPSSQRASKLRSPAYRAERLSYTNSGSGNNKNYYAQIPLTIQYLDQLHLNMVAERPDPKTKDVHYVLHIHKKQTELRWSVSRTFSEYRELQKRLMSVMQLGHFCNAECPWMYSFVKSQFPKECRFYSSTSYVVRKRLEAFQNCIATLHAHLLNRENHCCSIVTSAVAMELIRFLNTDLPVDSEARYFDSKSLSSSLPSSTDPSTSPLPMLDISIRYTDLEASSSGANVRSSRSNHSSRSSDCSICSHHHHHESANSPTSVGSRSPHPEDHSDDDGSDDAASVASASSSAYSRDFCQSFTTLSCGHQFHDECILERLNENMSCPTCGHAQK